jgi:hypothetical protein
MKASYGGSHTGRIGDHIVQFCNGMVTVNHHSIAMFVILATNGEERPCALEGFGPWLMASER